MAAALPEPVRAAGMPIEVWHQDEAGVGRQGTPACIRAKRGSRPSAPKDLRCEWAYPFGAVRPARGIGAGLVPPCANADMTSLHLTEIGRRVAPGAHALVVPDGAGWHRTGGRLAVPDNVTLPHQPPCSPEPNPVENVWRFPRQNHLGNRVFDNCDAIPTARCDAWQALMAAPERIRSIATRTWAQVS